MKFFICEHCGNIITMVQDKHVPVMCCGEKMKELLPGTTDGAFEKHVPVVKAEGTKVTDKGRRPDQIFKAGYKAGGRVCADRRRQRGGCV